MELRGDLESFPLAQLIQTLDNAQRTGKLGIEGHLGSFAIFFQKGRVIHAQSPYSNGLPAFFDAFLERDGTFNFVSNVIMPPGRITQSNTSLLIEATGLADEYTRSGIHTEPSELQVSLAENDSDAAVTLTADEFLLLRKAGEPESFDRILKEAEFGFFRAWTALNGLADKKMVTLSKSEA
ncbi:DUF4388 domain-containing protein [Candidatus Cryosericum terrychapinii]|jgi:hypothetical protein|uniref:DUF4388 domain-containing protein n=1 Tax=Candidatus Cryosericum terrychapinii TaxID=2290919 RepID=A0A398CUH0_9BACT|nr:DUF4388 domain-containing protein [Candidatus Cryosericum terrychapinii]RIE06213.1 DUF4388 domain-containing protein [Candidatus Cryosericum terrychapinii]